LFTAQAARAQKEKLLPPPEGSVTDFAGALDYNATKRLENLLATLKERAGIELTVLTVKTTGGKDIFDYSLRAAREWNIGAVQSKGNSLLLVVSTDDGKFFTQVSRRARGELPDGLIGEMGSRMREPFTKGSFAEGLLAGVETFVTKMAEKRGFSLDGTERAKEVTPAGPPRETPAVPAEAAKQTAEAADSVPKEPQAQTTEGAKQEAPAPGAAAAATTEPAPKAPAAKQPSVEDIFTKTPSSNVTATKTIVVARDTPEKAELNKLLQLPLAQRIEKLKAYIEANPRSAATPHAVELIVSARASLGDEKLRSGDAAGGLEQFELAIGETPEKMSDGLFLKVVSQMPLNIFLRGQRTAALAAARLIEAKVKDDPKRLLALAGFFLSVEEADEAARLSQAVIKLSPEMASAHQILGAAHHVGLRLDEAAAEYARALELDPKLATARQSLADLRRAGGKAEEALALYREQLTAAPGDKPARAGVVLSLLDLGRKEEAERELAAALKDDPRNMALLVGASYWHAAKGDPTQAQELANKAIEIEPRYTWAHIALARALVTQKRTLEAERVLRFARQYGNFPTLDYELASTLAATGLYEEAAAELARSFKLENGQIKTRLAGRVESQAADFIELLAPERRAGIFQASAADTEANARMLKGLLGFTSTLNAAEGRSVDAARLESAQNDFLAGEDGMLAYRQLFAASRLLARGVELNRVIELADGATGGVEAALSSPAATIAVLGEELRDARARAATSGSILAVGDVQRNILSNVMRGRIEDIKGWALFNQDKASEALPHLRRAVSVLPEPSAWWRSAQWHLGAALEATGSQQEALAAYLKAYNPQSPNPVQRAIIESLYRKVNGSLEGLETKIGAGVASVSSNASAPAAPGEAQPAPTTGQPKAEETEKKPVQGTNPVRQP
jgi:tetratricopeptide (TPR) repeat protein